MNKVKVKYYAYFAVHTIRMVTLGTLSTSQQLSLGTLSKTATHNTHILQKKRECEREKCYAEIRVCVAFEGDNYGSGHRKKHIRVIKYVTLKQQLYL